VEKVMGFIQRESKEASRALAEERMVFPNFEKSIYKNKENSRFRNATTTTIAPTGTLSIIAGCSSGIEPLFALSFVRNVMDNDKLLETNPYFEKVARERGFYSPELMDAVARSGSIRHLEGIPQDVKEVFVTAHDITPEWHVRMQAAFQKHCDSSISKTINFSHSATKEEVEQIVVREGKVQGVKARSGTYSAPVVVDAAGPFSKTVCETAGVHIPVTPDSHEAAITEPVKSFFTTMVVDLRPGPDSKNYYFYQNRLGQIVFCITPEPLIVGNDRRETSLFLPQVGARMVRLLPRLKNLRVRRMWRGLYPMTPDGSPLVGWNTQVQGLLHAAGMCGQGFMLGPGVGQVVARMITGKTSEEDKIILQGFDPYRNFGGQEALK